MKARVAISLCSRQEGPSRWQGLAAKRMQQPTYEKREKTGNLGPLPASTTAYREVQLVAAVVVLLGGGFVRKGWLAYEAGFVGVRSTCHGPRSELLPSGYATCNARQRLARGRISSIEPGNR